uniref:Uncharacterized protein n=1 Tax=Setaria digitata TaxID=48799 RepID=A0A915Q5Z8_9BILA
MLHFITAVLKRETSLATTVDDGTTVETIGTIETESSVDTTEYGTRSTSYNIKCANDSTVKNSPKHISAKPLPGKLLILRKGSHQEQEENDMITEMIRFLFIFSFSLCSIRRAIEGGKIKTWKNNQ